MKRILLFALLLCLLTLVCPKRVSGLPQTGSKPTPPRSSEKLSPEEEETQALEKVLRSAEGNPQALVKNLEGFLSRFPESPRRAQVLRTIYKQALQANDPQKAAAAAEKLLELNPDDLGLLSTVVDLLDGQADARSREQALRYATKFVERAEKGIPAPAPPEVPKEKWQETQSLVLATAYLMRGKVSAKSGEVDQAFADYEKSYATYPTAQVAERLGDLAAKANDLSRAVNYYATAFAFPGKASDPAHRDEVRKKLGSSYVALHQSEKGLGDLILARYDELMRTLASRLQEQKAPNADVRDPFDFVLQRPDGAPLPLADYRGKVVVMEFWATWCGPCRMEGKLFERVLESFRNEPAAAFLAVNVDEDRSGVSAFLKEEQWTTPVVYAQGLDRLLGVTALPTVMIFDRNGRVVFRQEGLSFQGFVETLQKKVREALQQPTPAADPSR